MLLLVAGVQYLLVRPRQSDASWTRLKQSVRELALRSFAPH